VIRLLVTAEGQTELKFVKEVLAPHLARFEIMAFARCVLTSKDKRASKEYRGGLLSYQKARADIITWMKEEPHRSNRFTTMFDLYALPIDFPGYYDASRTKNPYDRVLILETALAEDINDPRFIPYIQLHEFEALVLADVQHLDWEYLEHDKQIQRLVQALGDKNPELVDDGPETAPSKRILKEIPEYNKVTAGVSVAAHIGLKRLREKCEHFNAWICRLESLKK
jgi:hypothetical protein